VEGRQGKEHLLFAPVSARAPTQHLGDVGHQVAVGQLGGLGQAGRAAGELEDGGVVAGSMVMRRLGRRIGQQLLEEVDAGLGRTVFIMPLARTCLATLLRKSQPT
jgi:hypothetical protein